MTAPNGAEAATWTCPFCPLACDHLGVQAGADGSSLTLQGGDCARASQALQGFAAAPGQATLAAVDGQPTTLDGAIATAARWLADSRQPLFAGLGVDVAGARALYPLACATGAVSDAAGGDALTAGLRALQDRGQFTTTLAEVRTRADLIVFVGGLPTALAPLIGRRIGIGDDAVAQRHVVVLDPAPGDELALARWAGPGVTVSTVSADGDLFDTLSRLAALVAGRQLPQPAPALQALAQRLHAARYGVMVGAPALLPAQGSLLIEAVHRIVGSLNQTTRAAALWIGGGNGAATANQTFAWLSGLPLRSRAGPLGLEHEPLLFSSSRLLATGAVDLLLWVSSFDASAAPPDTPLPLIVLGPPALAARAHRPGAVFIAVATPGIGTDGHVFRTDGTVLMPLRAVRDDGLPLLPDVLRRLHAALPVGAAA